MVTKVLNEREMDNLKNIREFVLIIAITIGTHLLVGCHTGKQSSVSDYRLQIGDLESIMQSGNWLKFYTDFRSEPYTGNLNPGLMISRGRNYHIIKLEFRDQKLPFSLKDGDTLSLILDGSPLNLTGYNTSRQENSLGAYFEIDKWDLVDIGNASYVAVIIRAQEGEIKSSFFSENIYNYRYFASKYILGANDVPSPSKPVYIQPTAFVSGGAGTGTEFWFAFYTNFLKIEPGLSDYMAAGIGLERFEYSRYNYFSMKGYLWDGNFSLKNYNINLMYGLSYPSPFGEWSFELGFTYQYFFYDESWNYKNTGPDTYPTVYRLNNGNPYEGSVIGVFIQAGGFWVQFNRKRKWAIGITLPIPWW
jgi:hypothetical protein